MFLRDIDNSLKFVNKGIEHTPTLIDLYTLKSKIMEKAGDRSEAARLYEEAR
jgi:peptide alpha-N-acetyltransferase